jgi:CDP-diacylglycerol--serine O-phosphatidyltransferase
VLSISFLIEKSKIEYVPFLLLLGMFFDFFDGFVARLLKAYSEIGKQLDSLADLVSFGVAPSLFLYVIFQNIPESNFLLKYFCFFPAMMAAWRLAKFNIDTQQTKNFIGLPTPAATLSIIGFYWLMIDFNFLKNEWIILIFSALVGILMVLPVVLFSLKLKGWQWKANQIQYIFLVLSLILLFLFQLKALLLIMLLYMLMSLLFFKVQ